MYHKEISIFSPVLESSEWPSFGIYAGIVYSLGNYEECLLVSEYGVKGQYCLVTAIYDKTQKQDSINSYEWPDERASVWDALEKVNLKNYFIIILGLTLKDLHIFSRVLIENQLLNYLKVEIFT